MGFLEKPIGVIVIIMVVRMWIIMLTWTLILMVFISCFIPMNFLKD